MAKSEVPAGCECMQNRELSWLDFDRRVLDQGADETVPLLERLNFISIFWSNLQEFFMVRVGSLTDLSLLKKEVVDSKTGMTTTEQLAAIYRRCYDLYGEQESIYDEVRAQLAAHGVRRLAPEDLDKDQAAFLAKYMENNVMPFLSPQIINPHHPFPHLENGALYVMLRLDEDSTSKDSKDSKGKGGKGKNHAEGVTFGLIPLPHQCRRVIQLPGDGFQFILLEHVIEMFAADVFSMYSIKHTNIICVTRNADLDASEGTDVTEYDYRDHMKRILKKRTRLAPVRLESERPLSETLGAYLLDKLGLQPHQVYSTYVPLDLSYTYGLASMMPPKMRKKLVNKPFTPAWPTCLSQGRPMTEQVLQRDVLLSYPYESMDPFVRLLQEAALDPQVVSIKITLYRLASQSKLAEALIMAAERGKDVTALFELRARFDESNNIEWSQRFEQAGCTVIYGFRDYKVHSKICLITRQTDDGMSFITQLGTGNYNEKTARLYTDFSYITTDRAIAADACEFFRNMALESTSDAYRRLWVAPLQIKQNIIANIDEQIALARAGKPCGLFFKTNSVTDIDLIRKIVEASQEGVPTTMIVRGISCIVPGVKGYTENVRVVSIVGRLLEHSRIYGFGPHPSMKIYLSSADLMTRNMDKRIEIAWPMEDEGLRRKVLAYIDTCLNDTAKLRELRPDKSYTPLRFFADNDGVTFDAQCSMIEMAQAKQAQGESAAAEARRAKADEGRRAKAAIEDVEPEQLAAAAEEEASETVAEAAVEGIHEEPVVEEIGEEAVVEEVCEEAAGAAGQRPDVVAAVPTTPTTPATAPARPKAAAKAGKDETREPSVVAKLLAKAIVSFRRR